MTRRDKSSGAESSQLTENKCDGPRVGRDLLCSKKRKNLPLSGIMAYNVFPIPHGFPDTSCMNKDIGK